MNRRAAISTLALSSLPPATAASPQRTLGISIASYGIRWRAKAGWQNALDVLNHCQDLRASCLQIGVRGWTADFAHQVRTRRENLGITLEGQIRLPEPGENLDTFEAELKAAREAGSEILRTVCLGGRRYETWDRLQEWEQFVQNSRTRLEQVEPILARHQMRLAVENHKDWRIDEFLPLLDHLSSGWIGVNLDFGNNLALLEDPLEVTRALAPWLMSTHLKDMAIQRYPDGFLLSEVPLGQGTLNLDEMMRICLDANPDIQFNLEMITRDPLKIPVLTDNYWATMPAVTGRDLSRVLRMARSEDLPTVSSLNQDEKIATEEKHVRASFQHARQHLGCA